MIAAFADLPIGRQRVKPNELGHGWRRLTG
jgi:hypothetical protein